MPLFKELFRFLLVDAHVQKALVCQSLLHLTAPLAWESAQEQMQKWY